MSKIADYKAQVWKSLPLSEKQRARDLYIEIVKENGCIITEIKELSVDWEFTPDHKEVQKIINKTRGKDIKINSLNELTWKEKRMLDKKSHILSQRWKTKAQYKVIMSLYKQVEGTV